MKIGEKVRFVIREDKGSGLFEAFCVDMSVHAVDKDPIAAAEELVLAVDNLLMVCAQNRLKAELSPSPTLDDVFKIVSSKRMSPARKKTLKTWSHYGYIHRLSPDDVVGASSKNHSNLEMTQMCRVGVAV